MPASPSPGRLLLTGGTGFVGARLYPVLVEAGWEVRCLTRNPTRARERFGDRGWIAGDAGDPAALGAAMSGCRAAYYLVHGMGEQVADFHKLECETARNFATSAAAAGLERLVYLGGFRPQGPTTPHLQSRLDVGEILRSGSVPAIELRASMIIGEGSLSWLMVRDLAARLPAMVLPRWLKSRTQPLAVDDLMVALRAALSLPAAGGVWFDLPGPETLSGHQILVRTAHALGLSPPVTVEVPVLSPWLSSHWIRFVTRAEWGVAREIVIGMASDFLAEDARFWDLIGHAPMPFDDAARRAIAEAPRGPLPGFWGWVEGRRLRRRASA